MGCIKVCGDVKIWDESVVLIILFDCIVSYLRDLVGFAAFFPSNDSFRPVFFLFPLLFAVQLLLAPRSDGADFFFLFLAMGVSLFLRIPGGVFFVPSPLGFLGYSFFELALVCLKAIGYGVPSLKLICWLFLVRVRGGLAFQQEVRSQ